MVRIKLSDLDEAVRNFLAPVQRGQTIVVEDDAGKLQCGVTPYVEASSAEKQSALAMLDRMRQQVAQSVAQHGVSETEVDRELQD